MNAHDTDADWELFATLKPYFAVLTSDKYCRENLDDETIREFFETGEKYISWVFDQVRAQLNYEIVPERALDFGCGVGRLVIPLARRAASVTGLDISDSMLVEARKKCDALNLKNVTFAKGDDELSELKGKFDLIHSCLVFQHIPCKRGLPLIERLVDLLTDGGVGVLHVTYSKPKYENAREGNWPPPELTGAELCHSLTQKLLIRLRMLLRLPRRCVGKLLNRLIKNRRKAENVWNDMQMNCYALNPLLHSLQTAGIRRFHVEFTDHGDNYGVVLFFRKQPGSPYSA